MTTAVRQRSTKRSTTENAPINGVWLGIAAITLLGLGLRLVGLTTRSVWVDEVYGLHWASQPWWAIPGLLLQHETHPPLFYLLMHLWAPVTGSDVGLRLPSAIIGALTIPITGALGWQLGGRWVGLSAAGLMAVSPLAIWYSQEARPYALLTLLFALALLALLRLQDRPTLVMAATYALAIAAALYTHYGALVLLAGLTLGALPAAFAPAGRTWRRWWLGATGAAGLVFLPWLVAVVAQNRERLSSAYVVTYRTVAPALPMIGETVQVLVLDLAALGAPYWRLPGGRPEWLLVPVLGLAALGLIRLEAGRRWLVLGWLVGGVGAGWLLAQRYPIFFQTKVFVPLVPALLVLVALGVVSLAVWRRWLAGVAVVLLVVMSLSGLWRMYSGAPIPLAVEDWRTAAAYLATHAAPDDVALFLPAGRALAYERAAGGAPALATRGVPIDYAEATGTIEPALRPEHLPALSRLVDGRRQFWLVTVPPKDAPQINIPLALDYFGSRATLQEQVDLPGIVLYRYTT